MTNFNYLEAIMYLITYLLFICFIGVLVYGLKKYRKERRKGCIFVTAIVCLPLIYFVQQAAIFSLFFSNMCSFAQGDLKKAAVYVNIAAKLAVTPAQKSALYGELGQVYMAMKDGKTAIKYFDKAYKINGSYKVPANLLTSSQWPLLASMLYAYNEDYDKVYQIAKDADSYSVAAIASINQKDYKKALAYTNMCLAKSKSAANYSQRAYIYKKLNQNKLAQEDLNKAIAFCQENKKCIDRHNEVMNDSYWNFYIQKRKEYGFGK